MALHEMLNLCRALRERPDPPLHEGCGLGRPAETAGVDLADIAVGRDAEPGAFTELVDDIFHGKAGGSATEIRKMASCQSRPWAWVGSDRFVPS